MKRAIGAMGDVKQPIRLNPSVHPILKEGIIEDHDVIDCYKQSRPRRILTSLEPIRFRSSSAAFSYSHLIRRLQERVSSVRQEYTR